MTNFLLCILFIFNFCFIFGIKYKCSKTYIFPIFAQDLLCQNSEELRNCTRLIKNFIASCSEANYDRQLTSTFTFKTSTIYTCPGNSYFQQCLQNNDFSPNNSCGELKKITLETSYLEFKSMTYYEFGRNNIFVTPKHLCAIKIQPYTGPRKKFDSPTLEVVVGVPSGVILLLILVWIFFWTQRVWRRWQESKIEAFADNHARSARHILFGRYLDEFEVTPKELKVDQEKVLGQGAFGTVYLGHLKKTRNNELIEMDVAVKFPHPGASEMVRKDMIEEIGFMKALGRHENLLTMVGYVKSIENPVICTVYCSNGSLLSVLQKHPIHFMSKNKCGEVEICLLLPDLIRLSLEICNGLIYLASKGYIHRDIAARNILLTSDLQAKLSDFGLCKQLMDGRDFLIDKDGKFPIKHMPYESITMGQFSEKSDVWSFGILMVEMLTGGKNPFDTLEFDEFVEFLEEGGKPEFSEDVPQNLTQILNNYCFQKEPELRLNFVDLEREFKKFYDFVVLK